jgi:LmbE family N-acetylglucosaminyl deacetylase
LRQRVWPHLVVNVGEVMDRKVRMLAQHRSQKEWLDVSQGMEAYLNEMQGLSREVGRMTGSFEYAEGWRRHSHLGFGPEEYDPMKTLLEKYYAETPE